MDIEMELRDAWESEGNSRCVTFEEWVQNMANNDRGTLQEAAKEYIGRD